MEILSYGKNKDIIWLSPSRLAIGYGKEFGDGKGKASGRAYGDGNGYGGGSGWGSGYGSGDGGGTLTEYLNVTDKR